MSEPKLTSGPWEAVEDEILDSDGDVRVARVTLCGNPTEWQANAHLIAAAPDLYAALKAISDPAYGNPSMSEENERIEQMAEAALAKAEGRS